MKRIRDTGILLSALASLLIMGCGQQEFQKQELISGGLAEQYRFIPGKVDIVVVTDNSPSISIPMYASLQSQLSTFATGLKSKFWDYHVAKIDMWYPSDITKVLVNPDYNQATLPDGSANPNPIVPSWAAVTDPSQFSLIGTTQAGVMGDPTYTNLVDKLTRTQADTSTNFLRPDAMLAIIIVTNGMDELQSYPYETALSTSEQSALTNTANKLTALKLNMKQRIRFYPIVSPYYHGGTSQTGGSCLTSRDGTAIRGLSYTEMLRQNLLPGITMDVCDPSALSGAMAAIDANLTTVREDYVYSYLLLDKEPRQNSISVVRNGNETIPQDDTNGWTYIGWTSQYMITGIVDSGVVVDLALHGLNYRTGYMVRLNGTARATGASNPQVFYTPR